MWCFGLLISFLSPHCHMEFRHFVHFSKRYWIIYHSRKIHFVMLRAWRKDTTKRAIHSRISEPCIRKCSVQIMSPKLMANYTFYQTFFMCRRRRQSKSVLIFHRWKQKLKTFEIFISLFWSKRTEKIPVAHAFNRFLSWYSSFSWPRK
jgi:hypothetical protein